MNVRFQRPNVTGHLIEMSFGSYHMGGTYFTYGDGSVSYVSQSIDLRVYQAMATRNGNEVGP